MTFGWSIGQVLGLTWPQFECVTCNLYKLHYWRAKNEVFFGVGAAFGGEKSRRNLFDCAGGFVLDPGGGEAMPYTPEALAAAEARMADELRRREGDV
jgi:hypothetical protein